MFEHDRSAARGKMAVRELIVFKHESVLGNAPAYKLLETVSVKRIDPSVPARKYADYSVSVNTDSLPDGVSCIRMI
jgi:CRISPR-associated protein Csd2